MVNGNGTNTKQPRKSSFLHTLSRFGNKDKHNQPQQQQQSNPPSPSPPFDGSFPASSPSTSKVESDIGALPAYLTTLANHPTFKSARAWKRFVRVRTDDLQSQRVERTIKRVRSDVGGHSSPTSTTPGAGVSGAAGSALTRKESRQSTEQQRPVHAADAADIPLPSSAGSMLGSIHAIADDNEPQPPMTPSTAASSLRKVSTTSGGVDLEHEGDADVEDDEAPTTPVFSRPQPQSLTAAAASASIDQAVSPIAEPAPISVLAKDTAAELDERPDTPVQGDRTLVESESTPGVFGTSSESAASTLNNASPIETDVRLRRDVLPASTPTSTRTDEEEEGLTAPSPSELVSGTESTAATSVHNSYSVSARRSASLNSRKRVSSEDSISTAANKHNTHHHHHKPHYHHHRSAPVRELDTEAEADFDTDIEHPSSSMANGKGTGGGGVMSDTGGGAVTDSELLKGNAISSIIGALKQRKKKPSKKVDINDFDMMRVLGKGCAGKVRFT